jgi:diadenylate cyclase
VIVHQLLRWQAIVDLLVLSTGIYFLLWWARRARALRIILSLLALQIASLVTRHFEMLITSWVLEAAVAVGLVVLVLAFQTEVRYAVLRLDGVLRLWPRRATTSPNEPAQAIAEAAFALAARRVGSLVVVERRNSVAELVRDGVLVGANATAELLESLFQKDTPLHDGAVIVEETRITRAGVFLPLTQRRDVPLEYGARHRAAMGLAERCDALVVVTSEERGEVTLVEGHDAQRCDSVSQLALALERFDERERGKRDGAWKRVVLANYQYKLAALGIGAVIWLMTFLLAGTTVRTVAVPLEFVNVPAGLEIAAESADHLDVQLGGNAWVMDSLNLNALVARIDLASAKEGRESLRVRAGNINLPPEVTVQRTVPEWIQITLAKR